MSPGINKALSAAVLRLLRPLVRLLLRNGVSYGAFADLAKWVYVDVANKEFGVAARKQTDSRISVITGLTRKDVARLKGTAAPDDTAAVEHYHRAARVIGGWMRDELLRVGTVERGKNGTLRLVTAGYVPKGSSTDQLHILGSDVALLIGTIDHNLTPDQREPYIQRKVAYDNLPVEALAPLRAMTEEKAQALLEEINRYLAKHDRDTNPAAQGSGRKRAGVGIFYFERDVDEEK